MARLGALAMAVAMLLVAGCSEAAFDPSADGTQGAAVPESVPELDLFEQPVADAPDPAERAGAASSHVSCDSDLWNGGWSLDVGEYPPAPSAEGALAEFIESRLFGLPNGGYELAGTDTGRMLYTYSVESVPKVAVIVAHTSTDVEHHDGEEGWAFETFASCDPSEFGTEASAEAFYQVWTDREGNRVPTSIISSFPGAEHCGWESVTYLSIGGTYYLRDPNQLLASALIAAYTTVGELPGDAIYTGYRRDGSELWLAADETVAYLVGTDGIEAWPSVAAPRATFCY